MLANLLTLTNVAIAGEYDFWLVRFAAALPSLTLLAVPIYQYDFRVRRMRLAKKLAEIEEMEMAVFEAKKYRRQTGSLLGRSELQIFGFMLLIAAVISSAVFWPSICGELHFSPGKLARLAKSRR
ncbi:MAG: hypothetical protein HC849_10700 [Oscillatoriales cyanobacterium RU_3_3]|nr:hypothetical protein [Oscillatoriales cyanobacterium RU_3_3]